MVERLPSITGAQGSVPGTRYSQGELGLSDSVRSRLSFPNVGRTADLPPYTQPLGNIKRRQRKD